MFSSYFFLCLVSASVTDAFLPPIQSKSSFVTSSRKLCVPDGRVGDIDEWVTWSNHSLLKLTGTSLLDRMEGIDSIHDVHSCSRYAVLSHGTQQDPIYNYFNQGALLTFQWPEDEVYQLPSRYSAPGGKLRDQRDILMERVVQEQAQTFPEAIRQTKTGQPFRLTDVLLWNVFDTEGSRVGQTALFDRDLIVQLDSLDEY
jgi:MEKHLA domain